MYNSWIKGIENIATYMELNRVNKTNFEANKFDFLEINKSQTLENSGRARQGFKRSVMMRLLNFHEFHCKDFLLIVSLNHYLDVHQKIKSKTYISNFHKTFLNKMYTVDGSLLWNDTTHKNYCLYIIKLLQLFFGQML